MSSTVWESRNADTLSDLGEGAKLLLLLKQREVGVKVIAPKETGQTHYKFSETELTTGPAKEEKWTAFRPLEIFALDVSPKESWVQAARKLFQKAIHLRNRFVSGKKTLNGFWRRVTQTENRLDRLLEKQLENEAAQKLQTRFSIHRDKLLTFLHYPAVPPTNNKSNHALRGSVLHRKVTNGFRSK